jgi:16S rRNA processing protein RimM
VNPGEPDQQWVAVATLGRTRGNRGELTAYALSKPERFETLREVFLLPGALRQELESAWFHDNCLVLKFRGVDSISDAEKLVGSEVCVPRAERMRLAADEYYESDLIGCEVLEREGGISLGRVVRFDDGGSSGLLELDGGLLIPFVRAICVSIDPQARRIVVDLPAGLKELYQS